MMFLNVLAVAVLVVCIISAVNDKWKQLEHNQSTFAVNWSGRIHKSIFFEMILIMLSGCWLISVYLENGKIF